MKFTLESAKDTAGFRSAAGLLRFLFGGNEMNLAKLEKLIEQFTGTDTEHTLRWAADKIRTLSDLMASCNTHKLSLDDTIDKIQQWTDERSKLIVVNTDK
jgi:hypothetical protein